MLVKKYPQHKILFCKFLTKLYILFCGKFLLKIDSWIRELSEYYLDLSGTFTLCSLIELFVLIVLLVIDYLT